MAGEFKGFKSSRGSRGRRREAGFRWVKPGFRFQVSSFKRPVAVSSRVQEFKRFKGSRGSRGRRRETGFRWVKPGFRFQVSSFKSSRSSRVQEVQEFKSSSRRRRETGFRVQAAGGGGFKSSRGSRVQAAGGGRLVSGFRVQGSSFRVQAALGGSLGSGFKPPEADGFKGFKGVKSSSRLWRVSSRVQEVQGFKALCAWVQEFKGFKGPEYDYEKVSKDIDELVEIAKQFDNMETVRKMKQIVPEYKSNNSVYEVLDNNG